MTGLTVAGIVLVLALIIGVGLYSGRKVKNAKDFLTGGGKAGPGLVCGALMGSLVSSQSTLGSVQLAFHYGLAAWWFTLGSGLGCLLMALGYARALRNSGCVTELQIISGEYGGTVESIGSVLSATGIFITVLSQVMGCIGLFTLMFPSMSVTTAAALAVLVMCCYVIFGGAWGAGMGGVVKVVLLYLSLMGGMVLVLRSEGGLDGLTAALSSLLGGTPLGLVQQAANNVPNLTGAADIPRRFMNLTARGTMKDLGSCVSLLLGVLSTQTYAQAVWSGRTDSDARKGVLLSAFLIPPLGIAGVLMGLSMRAHYITAAEAAHMVASAISTVRYCASMARPSIIVPMCTISTGMNVIARLISPVVLNKSAGIPSQKAARIMAEETKRMETSARVREAIRSPTVKKPSTTRID